MIIKDNTIMDYEPYFDKNVNVATIDHVNKEVRPRHGYFKPHKYGKASEAYAKTIGYRFNNN